jgi:hypothetical protein
MDNLSRVKIEHVAYNDRSEDWVVAGGLSLLGRHSLGREYNALVGGYLSHHVRLFASNTHLLLI